jgi:hypothetical protein
MGLPINRLNNEIKKIKALFKWKTLFICISFYTSFNYKYN